LRLKGLFRDLIIYVAIHTIAISSLTILGESRIDAYVSIAILTYFISTTILPSIREASNLRLVDIVLIAVFAFIVAVRVLEILGYRLLAMPS